MRGVVRGFCAAGIALLCLCGAWSFARADASSGKSENLRFTARVSAADPFDASNESPSSPGYSARPASSSQPVRVKPGETFRLIIVGEVKPGYHSYPLVGTPSQVQLAKLVYTVNPALVPLWPVQQPEGVTVKDPEFGLVREYTGTFEWSQEVLVRPDAKPGLHTLKFKVDSQVCDEKNCVPVRKDLEATVEVTVGPAAPLTADLQKREKEPPPSYARFYRPNPYIQPNPNKAAVASGPSPFLPSASQYEADMKRLAKQIIVPANLQGAAGGDQSDLLSFILAGMFWGVVSLITPCVFPMIPITVSFFLKQSEKEHHRPVTMALVYCVTIVAVLTIAAVALLNFFQALSVNPYTNYGLGALFIFFALSLFGMYEIELPSGLARFTSEREGKGGFVGTVFMALTFTIISFACVAPFLGGFSGTSAGVQRPLWHTILGGIAFSATFAAPFFFLALFPTLLKKMPKSGSWLNSVKVVMGFLELAAALKFLRAGELAGSTSTPSFLTYDFTLGLYVALSVLCGLYLLGIYRLPHDTPAEHLGVPRLMFSLLFLGLAFYLAPALFSYNAEGERQRPSGTVFAWVDSFLLPDAQPGGKGEVWTGNLDYAVARAREHRSRTGKPKFVFIDFTGKLCTNCKINERDVFSKPEMKRLFQSYELVQIFTDYVPIEFYPPDERARLQKDQSRLRDDAVEVNLPFQQALFKTSELPLYAILEPRPDNTIMTVAIYSEGRIRNQGAFAQFLSAPLRGGSSGSVAQAGGR